MNKNLSKKIKSSAFAIFIICGSSLFAQQYNIESLKSAMYENNPDILSLQEEYSRSLLDVKDAKAGLGPTIDLQVSGTYMLNPPVDAIYLNVDDLLSSIQWPSGVRPSSGQYVKLYDGMENTLYNFSLSMTQPVFTWGKLGNAIEIYKEISQLKKSQLDSKKQQLDVELETRLITLNYLSKIVQILDEEKEYAEKMVKTSEDAEKSGMLLHQDVVDARIQAKELEIAQQDLNEQIKNQLIELERTTGIEKISLEDLKFDFNEEEIISILEKDRTELENSALSENQLSIKMLEQLKQVNKTAVKIAKGYENWKPDVAMQLSTGYSGSRFPFVEKNWYRKDDYSVNISIGLKTTVWDGGKKLRDISRKMSEVSTAEINQMDARSTIKKTLSTQFNTADVCTMKIEYQNLKIESAEAKIKQQETIFNTGYGSETDLLSAKIEKCNQMIEKTKQELTRAAACMTIQYLVSEK